MASIPTIHDTARDVKASLDVDEKHDSSLAVPLVRTESIYSTDSSNTLPQYKACDDVASNDRYPLQNFSPGNSLVIKARGVRWLRLPVPDSELEIDVLNSIDETLAYTSTRAKRRSGNAVLSHPTLGELISTSYRFGPRREPEICYLQLPSYDDTLGAAGGDSHQEAVKIKSQWTSRRIEMLDSKQTRVYEWRYVKTKSADGKNVKFLALMLKDGSAGDGDKMIAQLRRDEVTRTPGSSKCTAGNGGQLVLDKDATSYMDESLIVATCIMMLKKEIDRRRCAQFAILAAIAGGHGS